ncbi:hypothetical protein ACA910_012475 [Epithemia clementina (nom. ined.)]
MATESPATLTELVEAGWTLHLVFQQPHKVAMWRQEPVPTPLTSVLRAPEMIHAGINHLSSNSVLSTETAGSVGKTQRQQRPNPVADSTMGTDSPAKGRQETKIMELSLRCGMDG